MGTFRYLDLIPASFVAVLLISNIASTKILDLKWFTFDGGTILFPLAYIFGDILTEVYGFARSRRVIWTGFIWIAVAAGVFYLVDRLPAASERRSCAPAISPPGGGARRVRDRRRAPGLQPAATDACRRGGIRATRASA